MQRKSKRRTGSFVAKTGAGKSVKVLIYTTFIEGRALDGTVHSQKGLSELMTSDGRHVNRIGKGKYQIVDVPTIDLMSDDPNAP